MKNLLSFILVIVTSLPLFAATSKSGQVSFYQGTGIVGTNDLLFDRTNRVFTVKGNAIVTNLTVRSFFTNLGVGAGKILMNDANQVIMPVGIGAGINWDGTTLSASSTTPPWTNIAGVLQPNGVGANTNAIKIFPNGALYVGNNSEGWWGAPIGGETMISMRGSNEVNFNEIVMGNLNTDLTATYFDFFTITNQISLKGYIADTLVFDLYPSAPDGSTPYTFDTSVLHTSGLLAVFANKGTNVFTIDDTGATTTLTIGEALAATNYAAIKSITTENAAGAATVEAQSSFDNFTLTEATARVQALGTGAARMSVFSTLDGYTDYTEAEMESSSDGASFSLQNNDEDIMRLSFDNVATAPNYVFDTKVHHTSGTLFELENFNTNKWTLDFAGNTVQAGSFTTKAPTGGSLSTNNFGAKETGLTVTLNLTNAVRIEVNGTKYWMMVANETPP